MWDDRDQFYYDSMECNGFGSVLLYCVVLYYSQVACGMTETSSTTTAWNVTALVQFYCIVLYY